MKKWFKYLLVVLILPIAFLFVGCDNNTEIVRIQSIDKTGTNGLEETYTLTYTDGTTEQFTIINTECVSIASIEKTGSNGLVDTYTITYTNGGTDQFTITNGEKGDTGSQGISVSSIEKTGSVGLVDIYTITYTNGQTQEFRINNGEDGENLYSNITVNDLFEHVKNSENKPTDYDIVDFINEYLDIPINQNAIASAKALRSAVSIYVEHDVQIVDYAGSQGYNYKMIPSISWGAGSGVIYDLDTTSGDAYIITNYHVCYSADSITNDGIATKFVLYTYGGESLGTNLNMLSNYNKNNGATDYSKHFKFDQNGIPVVDYGWGAIEAEYVGGSEQYDIAVLKVSGSEVLKNSDYLEAEVYDSDLVSIGSTAIAIGNPGAGGIAVTRGVISIDSTYTEIEITNSDKPVSLREFRIDTSVNSGNSGGGLFDDCGRLIGIVNAKYMGAEYDDINYAIPGNVATRVADLIIDTCDGDDRVADRILVGISIQTAHSSGYYDEEDCVMRIKEIIKVALVSGDSLASNAGLQVGDILNSVEIIGQNRTIKIQIDRRFKMIDAMLYVREGDCIKFNYTRNNETGSATTSIITSDNLIEIP